MSDLAPDIVELTPCLAPTWSAPLREVPFRASAWLPHEDEALRALFVADAPLDDIADQIGRGRAGVQVRLYALGLRRHSHRPWSGLDDEDLARRYGVDATAAIAQDLGRSVQAVYVHAQLLGLALKENPPPWTPWEDLQLAEGYRRGVPVGQLCALIGRPFGGTIGRAGALGLRHVHKPADWSDAETARALELAHEGARYIEIIGQLAAEGFPPRTKAGFNPKIRKLGYGRGWGRPWTPDEDELLRRAYADGASLPQLMTRLGREPRHSAKSRAEYLGLNGTHVRKAGWLTEPVWTPEEDARLRDLYGTMSNTKLGEIIGRTKASCSSRANVLGLVHGYWSRLSDDEVRAVQIAWRQGVSLPDLAAALDRQLRVVWKVAKNLGIPFSDPNRPIKVGRGPRNGRLAPTLVQILAMERPAKRRRAKRLQRDRRVRRFQRQLRAGASA